MCRFATLDVVRDAVESDLDGVPPFVFIYKGVPVGRNQERKRTVAQIQVESITPSNEVREKRLRE